MRVPVSGYQGMDGDERANRFAWKRTETRFVVSGPACALGKIYFKQES